MKKAIKQKKIRVRCWVDIDGRKFLGPGRIELLRLIEETGSIAKAARSMKMSYKKAWAGVSEMNEAALNPFVVAKKGGKKGGGTELTEAGRKVVEAYTKLLSRINLIISKERDLLEFI